MDEHYVLKEWKDVDFAALEAKYMPMVTEAEQEQDEEKFTDAVMMFCAELHDGHVHVVTDDKDRVEGCISYTVSYKPREYGLAMVQLDNGDVIAVCTTADVQKLGIKDGTVITKWNGKDILTACAEEVPNLGMSVKENAERIAAIVLSGVGGDTIEVSFLDSNGTEQTVTLKDLGDPHTQLEAFRLYRHFEKLGAENEYDSILIGYMTGNHAKAREMFREKLRGLKAQGMEYLIIDIRNNQGGYDEIANALCDLFSTEDMDHYAVGVRKNGVFKSTSTHGIKGDGEFADLKVLVLTNYGCLSAGDGATLYLSMMPNVTVAGLTDSYGCNQETGGISALTGGHIYVGFPVGPVLDGNGNPNIDTRKDCVSRNPVDVRIPLDYDAAMKIFRDKEDYELNWAMQYLRSNA